ncbi:hypothetical protein WA026_022032 [Henosepilachna vigintioctopunctata]|uniref:PiggyBac transposable element-derived protein domain-containing protein n=1 Tax=Henosepilachna vigintioctopunctata TaxID=420089 RepID=A0AAW1V2M9_9CUCU
MDKEERETTDTEQEASDNDDDDIALSGIQRQMYFSIRRSNKPNSSDAETSDHELLISPYSGKDGTIWRKQPFKQNVRIRSENIINFVAGVQSGARYAKSEKEVADCQDPTKKSYMKECDQNELMAFFGLLFIAGVQRSGRQNLSDLWA